MHLAQTQTAYRMRETMFIVLSTLNDVQEKIPAQSHVRISCFFRTTWINPVLKVLTDISLKLSTSDVLQHNDIKIIRCWRASLTLRNPNIRELVYQKL